MDRKFLPPFLCFLAITPLAIFLSFVLLEGTGGYTAMVLFPLPFYTLFFWQFYALGFLLWVLQFPLYGVLLGIANRLGKLRPALLALTAFHLLAVAALFAYVYSKHFLQLD